MDSSHCTERHEEGCADAGENEMSYAEHAVAAARVSWRTVTLFSFDGLPTSGWFCVFACTCRGGHSPWWEFDLVVFDVSRFGCVIFIGTAVDLHRRKWWGFHSLSESIKLVLCLGCMVARICFLIRIACKCLGISSIFKGQNEGVFYVLSAASIQLV